MRILYICLVALGWFLEVFWYYWRFIQDGTPAWVSMTEGVALTLFLSVVAYARTKQPDRYTAALFFAICAYSIFCTSGGQAYNLNTKLNAADAISTEQQQQQRKDAIRAESIDRQIARLESDLDTVRQQLGGVATIEDRAVWRTTVKAAEEQQSEIIAQIEAFEIEKMALDYVDTERDQRTENIYQYYSALIGWSADTLQIILQTLFSAFIAFMAPFGIAALAHRQTPEPAPKKRKRAPKTIKCADVERLVDVTWSQITAGRGDKIVPREVFMDYMAKHGGFAIWKYDRISRAMAREGIIDGNRILIPDTVEVKNKLMEVLKCTKNGKK